MAGHVFISYSQPDRAYVERLAAHLTASGIAVWYDYQISAGSRFDAEIQRQLDECVAVIVVLSPASVESVWVNREIGYADDRRKPIMPLLLQPCMPPIRLQSVQHEDVTGGRLPSPVFITRLHRAFADREAYPGYRQNWPDEPVSDQRRPATFTGGWPVAARVATAFLAAPAPVALGLLGQSVGNGSGSMALGVIGALAGDLMWASAIVFAVKKRRPTLIMDETGITVGRGRVRWLYPWSEFTAAEVRSEYLVAVAPPGSLNGSYRHDLGGFLICRLRQVGATPVQMQEAINRFTPAPRA